MLEKNLFEPDIITITNCLCYGGIVLNLNKVELVVADKGCVMIMLQVAEGSITKESLVEWIRVRIKR